MLRQSWNIFSTLVYVSWSRCPTSEAVSVRSPGLISSHSFYVGSTAPEKGKAVHTSEVIACFSPLPGKWKENLNFETDSLHYQVHVIYTLAKKS